MQPPSHLLLQDLEAPNLPEREAKYILFALSMSTTYSFATNCFGFAGCQFPKANQAGVLWPRYFQKSSFRIVHFSQQGWGAVAGCEVHKFAKTTCLLSVTEARASPAVLHLQLGNLAKVANCQVWNIFAKLKKKTISNGLANWAWQK